MIDVARPADEGQDVAVGAQRGLPPVLPVLPLRETVPLPDTLTPLAVGQERSIRLVNDVLGGDRMLVMVASRDPDVEQPGPDDLYARRRRRRDRAHDQGARRHAARSSSRAASACASTSWVRETPYLVARVAEEPDVVGESPELEALTRNVQQTFSRIVEEVPYLPEELQIAVANLDDPSALSHLIAGSLRIKTEEKQELLEELDVAQRLRRLSEILARELEVISIGSKIQSQVQSEIDKRASASTSCASSSRRSRTELGEVDESAAEVDELREQLDAARAARGRPARRPSASSRASSSCRRRRPSTA